MVGKMRIWTEYNRKYTKFIDGEQRVQPVLNGYFTVVEEADKKPGFSGEKPVLYGFHFNDKGVPDCPTTEEITRKI